MDEGARRFRFLTRLADLEEGRRARVLARIEGCDAALAEDLRRRLELVDASTNVLELQGIQGLGRLFGSEADGGPREDSAGGWLLAPGLVIEGHRIQAPLSRGGMGQVYRALELETDRPVALKLLSASEATEKVQTRFHQEIQALARLEHPGVARLYRHGIVETVLGKRPWFTMELVHGQWVTEFAWEGPGRPTRERVEALLEVATAVGFAHDHDIVHRDIKAANVLVDGDGRVHLVDFGIAHLDEPNAEALTHTNDLVGTPESMSPEQLEGKPGLVGFPSDVYALGVLGYQLLARRRPFEMDDDGWLEFVRRVREGVYPRLESILPSVDRDLATVVHKALRRDPRDRYRDANDLAGDLGRWLRGEPIHARRPSVWKRARWAIRRYPVRATAGSLVLLGVLLGGPVLVAWNSNRVRAAAWTQDQLAEQMEERLGRAFLTLAEAGTKSTKSRAAAEEFDALAAEPTAPVEARIGRVLAWIAAGESARALGILDQGGVESVGSAQIERRLRFEAERALGQIPSSVAQPEGLGEPATPLEHWARGNSRLWRAYGTRKPGDFALAAEDLHAALLASPKPRALHYFEYARAIWRAGDVVGARILAPVLEPHWPRSSVAAHSAGCCYLTARQFQEAAAAFERALELDGDLIEARGMLANSLAMQGRLEEALPHFQFMRDQDPRRPESHQNLGTVLLNLGRYRESIPLFERAAELAPGWPRPFAHLANAHAYLGEDEAGILAAQEALRLEPGDIEARTTLATLMNRNGRYEELLPYVEEGTRRSPDRDPMWFSHGLVLLELGRPREAIEVLDQGIERFPESAGLYAVRGSARVELGFFGLGLGDFEIAEGILGQPFDASSSYWGWIEDAREFEPLEPEAERILAGELVPKDGLEAAGFARLAYALGAMESAAGYFDLAIELDGVLGLDPAVGWEFDAACAWARAAEDAEGALEDGVDPQEQLAERALDRLQGAWGELEVAVEGGAMGDGVAGELLRHWLGDSDLDPIRPDSESCLLSAELHADADELWWDVEQLLDRLSP